MSCLWWYPTCANRRILYVTNVFPPHYFPVTYFHQSIPLYHTCYKGHLLERNMIYSLERTMIGVLWCLLTASNGVKSYCTILQWRFLPNSYVDLCFLFTFLLQQGTLLCFFVIYRLYVDSHEYQSLVPIFKQVWAVSVFFFLIQNFIKNGIQNIQDKNKQKQVWSVNYILYNSKIYIQWQEKQR